VSMLFREGVTCDALVQGTSGPFSGLTLRSSSLPLSEAQPLAIGVPLSPIGNPHGDWLLYRVEVPAEAAYLDVQTTGGSGDAELRVGPGPVPFNSTWRCTAGFAGDERGTVA